MSTDAGAWLMHEARRVAYREVVSSWMSAADTVPTAAYLRCLELLDDHAFVPNSRLMGDISDAMFASNTVLAQRLSRMSAHESAGAKIIERVANDHAPVSLRSLLLAHARDEYRHGRMLAGFCGKLSQRGGVAVHVPELSTLDHEHAFNGDLVNFLFATHVAELRNLAVILQYSRAIAGAAPSVQGALRRLIEVLAADEQRHVIYTAVLCNSLVRESEPNERMFGHYVDLYDGEGWSEVSAVAALLAAERMGHGSTHKDRDNESGLRRDEDPIQHLG